MRYIFYLGTILLLSNTFAANPPKVIVATGRPDTTYNIMFKQLGTVCYSYAQWMEYETSGSTRNYELIQDSTNDITADDILANNKLKYKRTDLAFMQHDLLQLDDIINNSDRSLKREIKEVLPSYEKRDDKKLQTFLDLHSEEVHLISKKGSSTSLKDSKKIASWGGSFITAAIIKNKFGLKYKIVKHTDAKQALKSLENEKVDLILAVDGQPTKWIKELDDHKLIPIQYNKKLKNIYRSGKLKSNLYEKLIKYDIPTITVRNAIVLKTPIDKNLINTLNDYEKCAKKAIPILANPHEKWKDIDK